MKKIVYLFLFLLPFGLLVLQQGCSSTKKSVPTEDQKVQDDYDEIERLLGITRDEKPADQTQQTPSKKTEKAEKSDDLLKLLEVNEGKKQTKETPQKTVAEKQTSGLKNQVESLRDGIREKNLEVANLRAELLKKESKSEKPIQPQQGFYNTPRKTPAPAPSKRWVSGTYKADYERALSLFHQRSYRSALSAFEDLLVRDRNTDYSDNAQYWIGECYYAIGKYQEAILAFEKVFTFARSNKNDYAQFKIAQCYYMLGNRQRSRQEFQVFLDNYPGSELINRAHQYLAKL